MKLHLFILILSSLFLKISMAQVDSCNYSLNGSVLDISTKEPIPFATVKVKGKNNFTMTDKDGKFTLEGLCSEKALLEISCFGYCDSVCTHHHEHGESPHFYLTQKIEELETVLIEAERSKHDGTHSISQTTLKKSEMKKIPSSTLASSISGVEGVSFISTGSNVQLPIIHGLYGNRVLVLNNGLKHGFQNWSRDHAPEIDVNNANSITVIKGASGVRFGPEALAGAILVEPNPLHLRNPFYANLGTSYQTNGRGINTNIETGQGFKRWSYYLNGNYTKIGDRHAPDYQLTNSGREEYSFAGGTRFHYKSFDAQLHYSYVDQNLALLRSSIAESATSFRRVINSEEPSFISPFSYEINEPNQLTKHELAKAEVNWYINESHKITYRAGRQINNRQEFDVRRNAEKPIIDLTLTTTDHQVEWSHYNLLGLEGILGFQYFDQENRNNPGTGTTAFIPNYNSRRYSLFLVESKHFGANTIELGARIDNEENFVAGRDIKQNIFIDDYSFTNLTASIGYLRKLSDRSSYRTNLGSSWRSPNMAELYSFGQHGFKSTFGLLRYRFTETRILTDSVIPFSESEVKAERGYKFTNEFNFQGEASNQSLTLYTHYIENFIYERPYTVTSTVRGPMPVFIFEQADALFVGLDYSLQKEWNSNWSGTFGLSYLWSRNVEQDEALINQPPIRIRYEHRWNPNKIWIFQASQLSLRTTYTFEQFDAPRTVTPNQIIDREEIITPKSEIYDFADAPDGYLLFDLSWSFELASFRAGITIENLFNTAYRDYLNQMRYFADEPGRNFIFSLTYLLKTKRDQQKNDKQ